MHRPLNLSPSIVGQVPAEHNSHTVSDLKWVSTHIALTWLQRVEVRQAIDTIHHSSGYHL